MAWMSTVVAPRMRLFAVVLWAVALVLVPLALLTGGNPWLIPVPSVFTAFLAWAILWRPRFEVTDEALTIIDVRRTSTYPWRRVQEVRTKYGIEVVTTEGVRRTWLATRPTAALGIRHAGGGATTAADVRQVADVLRAHVPSPVVHDGPPPATVQAAIITHRVHGWSVTAMIVLGVAASMAAAQL
ncbi:hypothetical protein C1N91_04010 [Curtobacterium sp. SGAir0471]|nr:hypothetical protein C1N91_04010 [Curtobacterium sp. SGAir0471]